VAKSRRLKDPAKEPLQNLRLTSSAAVPGRVLKPFPKKPAEAPRPRQTAGKWEVAVKFRGARAGLTSVGVHDFMRAALSFLISHPAVSLSPGFVPSVSVLFTNELEMAVLNARWRGKQGPTDVLSFSQVEGAAPGSTAGLGDIVVSLPTAAKQARRYNWPLENEVKRLLIHGLLHLLGFEHVKVPSSIAKKMRLLEKTVLLETRRFKLMAPGTKNPWCRMRRIDNN